MRLSFYKSECNMRRLFLLLSVALCAVSPLLGQNVSVEENLERHVRYLSSEKLEGRKAGSDGERKAAEYVYDRLKGSGLEMLCSRQGQDFSIVLDGDSLTSRNVVAIVEGYDSELRDEYIVVGANIDNIGSNVLTIDGKKSLQVFPGADANASGVACMLELADRVASASFLFRRSVVFVAFGAKEMGMAGSWYFVNRAFSPISDVSLMIDLNMVGRGGPKNPFSYYTCVPNNDISNAVQRVSDNISFVRPSVGSGQMISSDYLAFYQREIPVALFTTGMHNDYRTLRDTPDMLEYESMERICEYLFSFVMDVANMDEKVAAPVMTQQGEGEEDVVYSPYDVDKAAQFFKGDESDFLTNWVYVYLRYPDNAVTMGIQGTVMVDFIVEKDGTVTNVHVTRSVDEDLDNEALRVVKASPKWKPAVKNGEKVRVKYSMPVEFRLKKR